MSEDRLQPPAEPGAFHVGERLRQARLARGMSLAEASGAMKISQHQVEAIELGQWERLPGHTITRGFVRNYARLLQLDAEPLVRALEQEGLPEPPPLQLPEATSATLPRPGRGRRRDLAMAAAGIAVVGLAVVLYFVVPVDFWKSRQRVEPSKSAVEVAAEAPLADAGKSADIPPEGLTRQAVPLSATPQEPAAESARTEPPAPKPDAVAVPRVEQKLAPQPAPAAGAPLPAPAVAGMPQSRVEVAKPAAVPVAPINAPGVTRTESRSDPARPDSVPQPAAPVKAAAAPSGKLSLRFSGDSWVEVKDADGKVVYSKLAHGGAVEEVVGKAPLTVVVGNASAAQLSFNGRPVDLAPHAKANVAKLTLQ